MPNRFHSIALARSCLGSENLEENGDGRGGWKEDALPKNEPFDQIKADPAKPLRPRRAA